MLRERSKLHQLQGREPDIDEIAARAGVPPVEVERVLSLVQEPTSLDLPVGEDGDATLGDLIEASTDDDPHLAAEASEMKELVVGALAGLTPREADILRMRFGIAGAHEHTLEEVGKTFGVTGERIRQIEAKALQKLRQASCGRTLAALVED